ncbi:MAG: sulfatase, partial [Opitutaceae bacterium]|nr:sulfatase [Opitutaceae bacterium]
MSSFIYRMRILYIDLDTLRPDHLGCYGYHRNTSPNIDSIAAEAVRFENTYASDAPCLPSRTALMTGRFGIHNGVVGHGGTTADLRIEGRKRGFQDCLPTDSLPGSLRQGTLQNPQFKTALISGFGTRHTIWPFYAGFHEIYDTGKGGSESAEEVTPVALKWLQDNADEENWFLHLNYWDPHTPYRAPESFGNPFADEPLPDWITDDVLEKHWNACGPHTAQEVGMWTGDDNPDFPRHPGQVKGREGLRRIFDGYDCGIAYVDSHLGQIFSALKAQGIFEDTAIIISADHGENMGELGLYAEHGTADHPTCRIPMIFKWPGGQKGTVNKGLHYHLDLAPTLAELMGKNSRPGWDGQSYASAILEGQEDGRDYLVISQCAHVCQRGVRWGPWLYIRTYHDGFHL